MSLSARSSEVRRVSSRSDPVPAGTRRTSFLGPLDPKHISPGDRTNQRRHGILYKPDISYQYPSKAFDHPPVTHLIMLFRGETAGPPGTTSG